MVEAQAKVWHQLPVLQLSLMEAVELLTLELERTRLQHDKLSVVEAVVLVHKAGNTPFQVEMVDV